MAGWRLCVLSSNIEALTIILWYATCVSVNFSVFSLLNNWIQSNSVISIVTSTSIVVTYTVLGLFADVFVGRYRTIQFSLWIKFLAAIMCTALISILTQYHYIHTGLQIVLYSILCIIDLLGESSFHVVATQFGTDQLQGAPSDHFSAFIFWYFIAEIISSVVFQWILYISTFKPASIQLAGSLLSTASISVVLALKNCFMSKWFVRDTVITGANRNDKMNISNPYRLIYDVLKYAKEHKCPVQRSALTYWEDDIPSRIDLGKRKYGGPFTNEEVESVKSFLQLFKILLSLSGVFIASYLINPFQKLSATGSASDSENISCVTLVNPLCLTATTGLLILCYIFSYMFKCHLSMLKRIGIGALLTIACVFSILLINLIQYTTTSINEDHIWLYINVAPKLLSYVSYFVLTVSLFEFIIAQSPHAMKGILIGFFYAIRFGVAGLLGLIEDYALKKLPTGTSGTIGSVVIIVIALVSFIAFSVVACKYKLRERDEVVNVHIFAEEYYGTREDDSNTDNSGCGYQECWHNLCQ